MNYFTKNRVITLVLVSLLVVSLSALGVIIYHSCILRRQSADSSCLNSNQFLVKELNLTPTQSDSLAKVKTSCACSSQCIMGELRAKRNELMKELSAENSDTAKLNILSAEIGKIQAKLTRATVDQYLRLKEICTPAQRVRLAGIYSAMLGCPMNSLVKNDGKGGGNCMDTGCSEMGKTDTASCCGK
jgi:Spy/CpxP family protein refolding chaperone